MQATRELVEEQGFSTLTAEAIIQKAGITPEVFHACYKDLPDLLVKFAHHYDYWLGNLNTGIFETLGEQAYFSQICLNLMHTLYGDRIMQRALIWELDSDNLVTRNVAKLRETLNKPLIEHFSRIGAATGVDIQATAALLVSGIYYMVLHSKRSTFCGVDFSTNEGKRRLASAIEFASASIFGKPAPVTPPPTKRSTTTSSPPFLWIVKDDSE